MSFVSLDRNVLFATAIVSAIVNGYNSASFKYSSEHYIDRLDGRETKHPFRRYFGPAVCQFISDLIISVVSLIPLFLMGNMPNAIVYSYLITLAILFVVGYYRATYSTCRDGACARNRHTRLGIILVGFTSGWIVHVALGA